MIDATHDTDALLDSPLCREDEPDGDAQAREEPDEDTPNPGSPAAIVAGCTCPVWDNEHGQGAWGTRGPDALFYYTQGCPVHAHLWPESLRQGVTHAP